MGDWITLGFGLIIDIAVLLLTTLLKNQGLQYSTLFMIPYYEKAFHLSSTISLCLFISLWIQHISLIKILNFLEGLPSNVFFMKSLIKLASIQTFCSFLFQQISKILFWTKIKSHSFQRPSIQVSCQWGPFFVSKSGYINYGIIHYSISNLHAL